MSEDMVSQEYCPTSSSYDLSTLSYDISCEPWKRVQYRFFRVFISPTYHCWHTTPLSPLLALTVTSHPARLHLGNLGLGCHFLNGALPDLTALFEVHSPLFLCSSCDNSREWHLPAWSSVSPTDLLCDLTVSCAPPPPLPCHTAVSRVWGLLICMKYSGETPGWGSL